MTRDMDLVREILLAVEARPEFDGTMRPATAVTLGIADHPEPEVIYHVVMLVEAGFLAGNIKLASAGVAMVSKITWQGHDFLDTIRDPEIWRATKEGAKKAGGFSLELLGALAKGLIKKQIEQRTGVLLDL